MNHPHTLADLTARTIVVTGANHQQMALLNMMVDSLRALPGGNALPISCMDLGLSPEDQQQLAVKGVSLCTPTHRFEVPGGPWPMWMNAYLAQPFMREFLPGWQTYLWIDADIWFQTRRGIDAALAGAREHGLAIAHERSRCYRLQPWLSAWMLKHFIRGFGVIEGSWLMTRPHLNSGFYAMNADAPHWEPWIEHYQAAMLRAGGPSPYGQFALNRVVYGPLGGRRGLQTALLAPWANWICDRGPPMWHDTEDAFCEPHAPYTPIPTLHLAGPGNHTAYMIGSTGGGVFEARIMPTTRPITTPRSV